MAVVVLHTDVKPGAPKDELDVLVQVEEVSEALHALGYEPVRVPFRIDLAEVISTLSGLDPLFAVNLVESVEGKGRLIHTAPAILDHLALPYTGGKTEAVFLTSNKLLAKKLMHSAGMPTPGWTTLDRLRRGIFPGPGQYIIKSVWEHASIGLDEGSVVDAPTCEHLLGELEARGGRSRGEWFAEQFVEGREFNLSILAGQGEPQVLPPAEIRFDSFPEGKMRVVGYRAKWDENSFEYHNTIRSFGFSHGDAPLLSRLDALARNCWDLFELSGYARVDFRVDRSGNPWVLEVNTNPCLSSDAGFIAAAGQGGLSLTHVVERIVSSLNLPAPIEG